MEKLSIGLQYFKKLKKEQMLIILLVGVLLFVIAIPVESESSEEMMKEDIASISEKQGDCPENQDYAKALEERLCDTLTSVAGVGEVKVMITLESTAETVVEKDIPNTRNTSSEADSAGGTRTSMDITSTESTVYMTEESGRQVPYVVMEIEPKIKGVVVVAGGGDNPVVVSAITEATQALFQLDVHKIKVMKMKNQK